MRATSCLVLLGLNILANLSFASSQCKYDGKHFESYDVVYKVYDERNDWCSIGICLPRGNIWKLVDLSCRRKGAISKVTTTSATTATSTTSEPVKPSLKGAAQTCLYKGAEYPVGSEVFRGIEKEKGTHYSLICSPNGEVIVSPKTKYHTNQPGIQTVPLTAPPRETAQSPTTEPAEPTTLPTTEPAEPTTLPTTVPITHPRGCYSDGKFYAPGAEISKGYDQSSNWCYGSYCDESGQVVQWDNFNCKSTTGTPEPPTTAPETTPPREIPTQPPTTELAKPTTLPTTEPTEPTTLPTTEPTEPTTLPTTEPTEPTTLPTTVPITHPRGCYSDGKFYAPGAEISKGYDQSSNWCYGSYCDESGQVVQWDNFKCKSTTGTPEPPTTAPETTPPREIPTQPSTTEPAKPTTLATTEPTEPTTLPTTVPITYPSGCYSDGKFYAPGAEISEGYDESSNWCYGSYCDESGHVVHWDNFNCKSTPEPPTTIPETIPSTAPLKETTQPPTSEPTEPTTPSTTVPTTFPRGCYSDGKFYEPGAAISKGYDETADWCYGLSCNWDGEIINWDTWNCKGKFTTLPQTPPTTSTLKTTLPSLKECVYDSRIYQRGNVVYETFDETKNWCYGLVCDESGRLVYWDKWNCKTAMTTPNSILSLEPSNVIGKIKEDGSDNVDRRTKQLECIYDGVKYKTRRFIKNLCVHDGRDLKCRLLFCNDEGVVIPKLVHDLTRKQDSKRVEIPFEK
ncbi:mucin-2-like isoform X2 [Rhopilema esculentum]|uniref:mucin-2-like isoform X2 n=1 Tax=Rhopilema esculentum TaxID=499914 RepID=UPI0031DD41CF